MDIGERFLEYLRKDEEIEVKRVKDNLYRILFKKAGMEIIIHEEKMFEMYEKISEILFEGA